MTPTRKLPWLAAFCATLTLTYAAPLDIQPLATLSLAGAEISAFDPGSKRIFVTANTGLQIVDVSEPANPTLISTINFTDHGLPATDVTSVSVAGGVAAVAIPAPVKTDNGFVAFINAADGTFISSVEVGSLPDALTFTPDGTKVLVANEGELSGEVIDDTALGTVSIINISGGFINPPVATADFTAYDTPQAIADLKAAGVRIFENGIPSLDFEPEYVAVSPDGTKAMVTLQEANAVAILDIASATFTSVVPLGEKDFSNLLADFSDRDGPGDTTAIKLTKGNPVFGLYMPDAIASYSVGGKTYYVIANEGDDRDDFLSVDETMRVGNANYILDENVFPNAAELKQNSRLGRLTVSNAPGLRGDLNGDGKVERILMLGGRSFSILDEDGNFVYDSGDFMERAIANFGPPWFDDTRSDNKSIEPEGITIGEIDGRQYAFVSVERSRGVMVFDVTNPLDVTPAGFATVPTDRNPEDITFISAADSPNGKNLIAVTNETSNTLTIYTVKPVDFTLQVLHLADAEAGLLASETAPNLAAILEGYQGTHPNTLILSGGDSFIPGPFLNAGTDPAITPVLRDVFANAGLSTAFARPDIGIHNILGVEASAVGNHEFDLGSNVFSDAITPSGAWVGATFPHLTVNIDFTADPLNARFTSVPLDGASTAVPDAAAHKGRIVPTATITKGGERIGLVGVTTQVLESISSPSGARVKGFAQPRTGVDDMDLLASQVQPFIDELIAEGVNKIILLSHLQQLTNERTLATKLSGVDIILAAGSNTRLGDADDVAVEFAGHAANFADTYPIRTSGRDGKPTLIINTDNEFTYLGRLVVDFNDGGEIIVPNLAMRSIENGAYAATAANAAAAWEVNEADLPTTAFAPGTKAARVKQITDAIQGVINAKDGLVFGFTDVYLEGERSFVRREETNLGNITADANIFALRSIIGGSAPIISLKNGGGIRAQIGAVSSEGGSAAKLPPLANPAAGKPAGGISRLDIENALRFNNGLMALETTPVGLKAILEHAVASWPGNGRFPQIGGMAFSWDISKPAGERVTSISLIGNDGLQSAAVYANGGFVPGVPAVINMITLNFLAQGGDSYPFKDNGENFRFLLTDGTLSAPVPETESFTSTAPGNLLREQQAFEKYLGHRYATSEAAFDLADTSIGNDTRIQKLDTRLDTILPFSLENMIRINRFSAAFLEQGVSPSVVATAPTMSGAIDESELVGRNQVITSPGTFGLFTAPGIKLDGIFLEFTENATLDMKLQSSGDLEIWADEAIVPGVTIDLSGNKRFFRFVGSASGN